MSEKLLLIDGNSIINRAFYGLAGRSVMTSADNTPTGAIYAFLNIYFKFLSEYSPSKVCVCFDLKGPTFRHKKYKEYKGTRKPMPEDLATQIPILKEILDAMGIVRSEMEGFEADDLVGSISAAASSKGWLTYILSGDKDNLQLVGDKTILLMPTTKSGNRITDEYTPQAVIDKYSIPPEHFIDLKAIMGDPSDNIPGVKGIGEKGATKLISEYKSLDRIYESLEDINKNMAAKLVNDKEMAYLSKELSTIKRDIDVKDIFEQMETSEENKSQMYNIFRKLGFRSIIDRLELSGKELEDENIQNKIPGINRKIVNISMDELSSVLDSSKLIPFPVIPNTKDLLKELSIDNSYFTTELKSIANTLYSRYISFVQIPECGILVDVGDENKIYSLGLKEYERFIKLVSDLDITLVGFKIKEFLRNINSSFYPLKIYDIAVGGYVLSLFEGDPSFDFLAQRTLKPGEYYPPEDKTKELPAQQSLFDSEDAQCKTVPNEKDIYVLSSIKNILSRQIELLKEQQSLFLCLYIEMPLVNILAEMEKTGFLINKDILTDLSKEFTVRIKGAEAKIFEYAGRQFNVSSPKQLSEVLFEDLGLPTRKKGITGYSTNAEVLESLRDKHPIIEEIFEYRELTKLKSTFIEGLTKSINPETGRVHSTFHQILTTTGRLSSSDPNIQNIPIRKESGREIRKAFTASPGSILVDADYSQIELRLLADFSGDEQMRKAFKDDDDIHLATAENLFDLPRDMITNSMRSIAKTINFSIVYGIGDFSLSKDLGITIAEAHKYIDEYHNRYPLIKPYLNSVLENAYLNGYVETLFKRRRYIEELKSSNKNVQSFGERAAMNAPLQGSAADIVKIAMVLLHNRIHDEGKDFKLLLQVHDELILEVPETEKETAAQMLSECMESAVKLQVPLVADVKTKFSWFDD